MQNPNPTYQSHDGYVFENVICCPEFLRNQAEKTKPEGTVIVTIPNSEDVAMQRALVEWSLAMSHGPGSAHTGLGVDVPIHFSHDLSIAGNDREHDEAK